MDGVEFTFVALADQGGNAGRRNMNDDFEFVLREYGSERDSDNAFRHAVEDDVVVFGHMGGKEQYVKARMAENKLTFRATERLLKRGYVWRFSPPKAFRTHSWFTKYKKKEMYVLCVSAFAAADLNLCGWPSEKCFKWGYYPGLGRDGGHKRPFSETASILWAARLIELKRPFAPLQLAKHLKADGYRFELTVVGDGPLREQMLTFIEKNNLSDVVSMAGMLTGDETKARMAASDIYITTSSCKEGWGITVNEAMGAGCAVVASASIGSAPYLIEDGKNGLLYDDFAESDLLGKVRILLDDRGLMEKLGKAARNTIDGSWSAEVAAQRLLLLAESLRAGGGTPFKAGPCSLADTLRNGWYHERSGDIGR